MPEGRRGVVVVSYGSSALLARNLVASTVPGDVVVVVDCFTDDGERAAVARLAERHGWLLEAPATNLGFGAGTNRGVARALAAGAGSVLLLNPDARIAPPDAARLHERVEQDPGVLVAPRILRPDGTPWLVRTARMDWGDGTMRPRSAPDGGADAGVLEWLSGACLAVGAQLWRKVGGFDEEYFLYWEDVDLSHRVRLAGGTLAVDGVATAHHDEGGTHPGRRRGRAKSETYYYFNVRNRLVFGARWLDDAGYRAWVRTVPRAVRAVLLQGGRAQLVTGAAPWRAAARGVRDGLAAGRRVRRAARGRGGAPGEHGAPGTGGAVPVGA
ncbi:glycosyltransferase family 2 protein [Xylanimonas oleitrophica]|uniref:Glycosyltransferase family 2 protein n=1 Tax=Xylanimonas oleitrophica TaxID=2607479 RepID=A0A2W5WSZ6_9MICO|nr:glycosyltransferase family 2 protein [Xylanimonas oleitrophica]PZR54250.1 glycosyltransferase family 2 protein [Xylanimonas oleitrophica]